MSSAPLRISNVLGRLPPNLEQSPESGSPCLQVQETKCRSCPEPPQTWGHGQKGVGMSTGVLMWLVAPCTPGTAGLLWGAWKTEVGLLPGLNSWVCILAGGRREKRRGLQMGEDPNPAFPGGFPILLAQSGAGSSWGRGASAVCWRGGVGCSCWSRLLPAEGSYWQFTACAGKSPEEALRVVEPRRNYISVNEV